MKINKSVLSWALCCSRKLMHSIIKQTCLARLSGSTDTNGTVCIRSTDTIYNTLTTRNFHGIEFFVTYLECWFLLVNILIFFLLINSRKCLSEVRTPLNYKCYYYYMKIIQPSIMQFNFQGRLIGINALESLYNHRVIIKLAKSIIVWVTFRY